MAKLRYEIDPHNRLVIEGKQKKTDIPRFRYVIDGKFKIEKGNTLVYHIKAPSGDIAKELKLPHQLKLSGCWALTHDHNLKLTLNKWGRQTFGDELTLKGEIIKVDAHSLLFAVTQRTDENTTSIYILKLEGNWQADEDNRLTFRIEKEKGNYDILVFDGVWEVNRRHQIVYHYERRATRKRKSRKYSLLFTGFWNLTKREVLTYQLGLKGKSAFDFRIGKGIVEGNAIKFEVGIGISRRENPFKRVIILYGKWKIKRGVGLIFEIEYADANLASMTFEAEAKLINNSKIKFALRNRTGQNLDMEFTLSKTMFKGRGESFIRILRSKEEKAIYIGSGFLW